MWIESKVFHKYIETHWGADRRLINAKSLNKSDGQLTLVSKCHLPKNQGKAFPVIVSNKLDIDSSVGRPTTAMQRSSGEWGDDILSFWGEQVISRGHNHHKRIFFA